MVPLTGDPLARSFATQLGVLRVDLLAAWKPEAPEAGFVMWAAGSSDTKLGLEVPLLEAETVPLQRWTEGPVLAAIGFRLAQLPATNRGPTAAKWRDGVSRLMTRDPIPADRNSFFFRPIELLGLAVGAQTLDASEASVSLWLRGLLEEHESLLPTKGAFSTVLNAVAARRVGATWQLENRLDAHTAIDTALLLWLSLADSDLAEQTTSVDRDQLYRHLLEQTAVTEAHPQGLAELGILYIALHRAVAVAAGHLQLGGLRAAEFVMQLCRRFPLLVAALADRYNNRAPVVTDEYDVQDVLRGVLHLHFDDVRREEWNPSYGGVQSRSDLLLKPERVVIETKMTRKGLGQRELVAQLTVDKAQYRGHHDCGTLVCFVYDPGHRLQNATAIERDLSDLDGPMRTVVVVSPRGL